MHATGGMAGLFAVGEAAGNDRGPVWRNAGARHGEEERQNRAGITENRRYIRPKAIPTRNVR